MATRRVELGTIGETVRANISRLRRDRGLTLRDLADRMAETDRPLAHNSISEIERGARRVDVDDLVALALALEVSPLAILFPVEDAALSPNGPTYPRQRIWSWGQGLEPIRNIHRDPIELLRFTKDSNPIQYEAAQSRQEAGEVSSHPVAVPRVAAKEQRAQRSKAITAVTEADDNGDD